MKEIKRLSIMTKSVIKRSYQRVVMSGKTYWKGVVLPNTLYGAEVIHMIGEEIDKFQKAENTAMRRILRAPKWAAQAARSKRQEVKNSKEQVSISKKDRNRK